MVPRRSVTGIRCCVVLLILGAFFSCVYVYDMIPTTSYLSSFSFANDFTNFQVTQQTNTTNSTIINGHNLSTYNNELFCPIQNKTGMYRLLHDIHKRQFLDDCYDENNKFWIYDLTYSCGGIGLFAMLNCWSFYFTQSFILQRTFLFHGSLYSYAPKQYCGEQSYQCFFLPISNCNATDIINYYKDKKSYAEFDRLKPNSITNKWKGLKMPYDAFNVFNAKDEIKENVWLLKHWSFHKNTMNQYALIKRKYNLNDVNEFELLLWNIFLRLKPNLIQEINNIVTKSLINSHIVNVNKLENLYNIKQHTLSMPIRWGDKCQNDLGNIGKTVTPEIYCWNVAEYMELAKILKEINSDLKYIIITSETKHIVQNVTNYTDIGYEYIKNVDDIMQGVSVFFNTKYSSNDNAITNMLSLLSTIRLHFASKYFIFTKMSNWIYKIFKMTVFLECEPIKRNIFINSELYRKQDMECIEINMPWTDRIRNEKERFERIGTLSTNLKKMYLQKAREPNKLNITISNTTVCDSPHNLDFF